MTTIAAGAALIEAPTDLPTSGRNRILIYLGFLTFSLGFGAPFGGLINLPVTFFLKNKLHMHAGEVSSFLLVAGLPLYFGFAWGFVRDLWNPFGLRDRGYMMIFGGLCAVGYVYFAFVPVSAATLLVAVTL